MLFHSYRALVPRALLCLLLLIGGGEKRLASAQNGVFGIGTNLLYDAATVPSVTLEASLGPHWSAGLDGGFACWKNYDKHFCHQVYDTELFVRRWFGSANDSQRLTGHHAGIYGQALHYDLQYGGDGRIARTPYLAAGLEYGYSFRIGEHLTLDLSAGAGYMRGRYENYTPKDGCDVWTGTFVRQWTGPTRARVSLVWLLGRGVSPRSGKEEAER